MLSDFANERASRLPPRGGGTTTAYASTGLYLKVFSALAADSDDADSAATVDEDAPTAAAAAVVGPSAFLPALDAGSHALAFLDDMSEDENPWYLDDLRAWDDERWHDNSAEENKLKLT